MAYFEVFHSIRVNTSIRTFEDNILLSFVIAGSVESAYWLVWGGLNILGLDGGEPLALL